MGAARHTLLCHPAQTVDAAISLTAALVADEGSGLRLDMALQGELDALLIPDDGEPGFADELWRHTCFELFVAGPDGAYQEFNFSPSGAWAAYRFSSYRQGMCACRHVIPLIEWRRQPDRLTLSCRLQPADAAPRRAGISAVIEDDRCRLSHWALHHAGDKADFHRPEGFVLNPDGGFSSAG